MRSETRSSENPRFYQRHLPHWQPPGASIFLTWRIFGSLPKEAIERLAEERALLNKQPCRPGESPRDRALRHSEGLFSLTDELLGYADQGPSWLADERIAKMMVDALFYHAGRLYSLLAFVVMPNHVHVLLTPLVMGGDEPADGPTGEQVPQYVPLRKITQSLKGYVAREANKLLNRTGKPFWQEESYDHWARNEAELARIITYIESDPVRSGLVANPEEWRWSSAYERRWGRLRDRMGEVV